MEALNLKPNSNIMIKTYMFESGLWYLAKSLASKLESEGHNIFFFPKAKYVKTNGWFSRTYPEPNNKEEFSDIITYPASVIDSIGNLVVDACKKYNIDVIISFETLMETSEWVSNVKEKTGVKVIDVPMAEWVTERFLRNNFYAVFDQIWALNNLTKKMFSYYSNVVSMSWDFVDRSIFYPNEKGNDIFTFYHMASLNPDFSTKNTELVLKAFDKILASNYSNLSLILTGFISKDKNNIMQKIIEKHNNIRYINRVLSRNEVADLYRNSHCILAPSSREGLGLNFYEAEACGCKLITTDAPPMNFHNTPYLCKPIGFSRGQGLVPLAVLSTEEIHKQVIKVYEDIKNGR